MNGVENVFVRNTCLGVIPTCTTGVVLASISTGINASPANGGSMVPWISADGHTVSFLSTASNLVARDNERLRGYFPRHHYVLMLLFFVWRVVGTRGFILRVALQFVAPTLRARSSA